ncbi:hypothetical protein Hte_012327 [Hypoxylon texense]
MSTVYNVSRPSRPQSKSETQRYPKLSRPIELQTFTIDGQGVQPGEHVRSVCREHDLSFPNVLRRLQGFKLKENPYKLVVVVSEKHCIQRNSMKYLDKFEHPFAKSILNMYVSQKRKPLWVAVSCLPEAKPVVCTTARRKFRHAFHDALAAHGYDREGRRIATEGGSSSVIADLCGTVQLTCGDPKVTCQAKFADLLESTMVIVSSLELALGRDKNGIRINPAQQLPKPKKKPYPSEQREWRGSKKMGTRPNARYYKD